MKICVVSPNFLEPTAWMVSAYKTALMLKGAGHDVVVLTTRTRGSKPFESIKGIKVYRMESVFIGDPFNYTFALHLKQNIKRLIKDEKPDVFIISKYMFYSSLAIFPLKRMKQKVILQTDTFPGMIWFAPSKLLNAIMWVYTRTLGKMVLRKADSVVLLHEGLVKTAKELGLRYHVIHNGIDFFQYRDAKPAKDLIKMKGKEPLVTFVGRLDAVKGYGLFIDMAQRLHRQGVHARYLMVVGDKNKELKKKLQKRYPFIAFTGFRKDIAEVWKASDIGVLSSFAEGLPNTVLEAMGSGVPVVASRVGGVPHIISHLNDGLTFKPGDVSALTKHVRMLVEDATLRKIMGKRAMQKVEKNFNLETIAKQWNELLEEADVRNMRHKYG